MYPGDQNPTMCDIPSEQDCISVYVCKGEVSVNQFKADPWQMEVELQ